MILCGAGPSSRLDCISYEEMEMRGTRHEHPFRVECTGCHVPAAASPGARPAAQGVEVVLRPLVVHTTVLQKGWPKADSVPRHLWVLRIICATRFWLTLVNGILRYSLHLLRYGLRFRTIDLYAAPLG